MTSSPIAGRGDHWTWVERRMSLINIVLDRAAGFIPVLLSLTVHEWAHAWTAWKLGDDTAKQLGRVSLNPIDHIDPVGTLLLPLLGIPFGWAKPVPVNPVRFRPTVNMSLGLLLVAAAGPISNFVLACASGAVMFALARLDLAEVAGGMGPENLRALYQILSTLIVVNVLLGCFNLLPIPPLDGSRIVDAVVPDALRPLWSQFTALGPLLLIAIILLPGFLGINLFYWPLHWAGSLMRWLTTG